VPGRATSCAAALWIFADFPIGQIIVPIERLLAIRGDGMTTLCRSTAVRATSLLAGCSGIWIVGGIARAQVIPWDTIGTLWLLGWPMLFVGFMLPDLVDTLVPRR
jgi:hypothetical protein